VNAKKRNIHKTALLMLSLQEVDGTKMWYKLPVLLYQSKQMYLLLMNGLTMWLQSKCH